MLYLVFHECVSYKKNKSNVTFTNTSANTVNTATEIMVKEYKRVKDQNKASNC